MLSHPTLDQLHALGLHGMIKGFKELNANPEARALEHPEWLALLLEHEITLRRQKRFEARARAARLRQSANRMPRPPVPPPKPRGNLLAHEASLHI
jgi:hypothetical protein